MLTCANLVVNPGEMTAMVQFSVNKLFKDSLRKEFAERVAMSWEKIPETVVEHFKKWPINYRLVAQRSILHERTYECLNLKTFVVQKI